MPEYLVKRRLYTGRGEYSEVDETITATDQEARPMLDSGALSSIPSIKQPAIEDEAMPAVVSVQVAPAAVEPPKQGRARK